MGGSKTAMFVANAGASGTLYADVMYREQDTTVQGILQEVVVLSILEPITQSFEELLKIPLEWQRLLECHQDSSLSMLELDVVFAEASLVHTATFKLAAQSFPLLIDWLSPNNDVVLSASWKPVEANVCLSVLQLTNAEKASLEHGALVMIPESFQAQWHATLSIGGLEYEGVYKPQEDQWIANESLSDSATEFAVVDVNKPYISAESSASNISGIVGDGSECYRLCVDYQVDTLRLHGVGANLTNVLADANNDSTPGSGMYLKAPTGECYRAHSLTLGAGQAVLLEQLESNAA